VLSKAAPQSTTEHVLTAAERARIVMVANEPRLAERRLSRERPGFTVGELGSAWVM